MSAASLGRKLARERASAIVPTEGPTDGPTEEMVPSAGVARASSTKFNKG
ncbi:hypothetical protein [Pseudenhygromyxa sp. WMMC2535]|nr:hypothetical protein [Pseudenhygromyxa sp. WMMC2535]